MREKQKFQSRLKCVQISRRKTVHFCARKENSKSLFKCRAKEREKEKTPRAVPRIDSQEVPKSINFVPKIPEFRDYFSTDHLLPSRFLLKGWLVFSLNA